MRLTDKQIKALKPREKDFKQADGQGLYLLVTKKGHKYWRLKYRFNGKEKLLSIGVYPEISLKEARAKTAEAKAALAEGNDPSIVKKQRARAAEVHTFEQLAREWFEVKRKDVAPTTEKRMLSMIDNWIVPYLGRFEAAKMGPLDVLEAIKIAEAQGKNDTAHRMRETCSQIFRYGIITQVCKHDPARDLIGALEKNRPQHYSAVTDPDAAGRLMADIELFEGTVIVKTALACSAYWFCRPIEVRSLEWSDVDFEGALITIPASRMKLRRDHIIPLATQSLALLEALKPITGRSKYVFPSARGNSRCMSENAVRVALRTMGYTKEMMTSHGFRAMARTLLDEELGYRVEWIEHQLAHEVRDANGRAYNRTSFLNQRREMMQSWADYIDSLREMKKQGVTIQRSFGAEHQSSSE
ncbi:tyrosine-type recombinase/integrase [Neptunomonas marina]|uniref:DUF4102 domain-containing protein n=1 Tax=Neptunomonas marina TaxID=1815562 RepID=A0A437QDT5_9GAMM|nr:integrase arm-type DNA-binding domain-containing protein [Neptunomonas marina]RVU32671.1 DUF4102 domain-containing protein [Neptunomonas marina]